MQSLRGRYSIRLLYLTHFFLLYALYCKSSKLQKNKMAAKKWPPKKFPQKKNFHPKKYSKKNFFLYLIVIFIGAV